MIIEGTKCRESLLKYINFSIIQNDYPNFYLQGNLQDLHISLTSDILNELLNSEIELHTQTEILDL